MTLILVVSFTYNQIKHLCQILHTARKMSRIILASFCIAKKITVAWVITQICSISSRAVTRLEEPAPAKLSKNDRSTRLNVDWVMGIKTAFQVFRNYSLNIHVLFYTIACALKSAPREHKNVLVDCHTLHSQLLQNSRWIGLKEKRI